MYRIERAVILAAGFGTRLKPLTDLTPKSLLPVNGVSMIESALEALYENNISDIYVVIGYQKETFSHLAQKYPGLCFIENPDYKETNNISSLYAARRHLRNALIMDGDQFVRNSEIFEKDFARSGYLVVHNEGPTHEWTLNVEKGVIVGCTRGGGCDEFRLLSVSLWSEADGVRLAEDIAHAYMTCNQKGIYWDDVPLFLVPEHYRLGVREVSANDLVEIDTLEDLVALDGTYNEVLKSRKDVHGRP